jgi:hypothetical protein
MLMTLQRVEYVLKYTVFDDALNSIDFVASDNRQTGEQFIALYTE